MPVAGVVARTLDAQRGALFPWSPVALAIGIGLYFSLRIEPQGVHWALLAVLASAVIYRLAVHGLGAPLTIFLAMCIAGFALAALRTHSVAEPVLAFRYYGAIEGRIVTIDRSASDKVRLTLDQVVLERMSHERLPSRVRVSLHGLQDHVRPEPGLRVLLTGHLSAPQGPVEPGGFDFQRHAWFKRIGAVGYTRTPVLVLAPADEGRTGLLIHRVRMTMSSAVQAALPGRAGAFAAAITTGDRSGMDEGTLESLRLSNLAHLLAISGLHMGLLTGFVFAVTRYGLALWPHAALHWPTHKIGAVVALLAGLFYLALSGGSVATERAFIMVGVMLVAVLFDRRALTIRAVALAALIVLCLRPEVLFGPGFQMSFAATAALIVVFQALRGSSLWTWHPVARWALALVLSSAVAGLATAPIAAAHFNRVPHFGLLANILSVPVMGALVMPAAVLSAVLAPLGLWHLGLAIMRPGIDWILWVADWVAGFDGTVSHVPAPGPAILPLIALGSITVFLWQGRLRAVGLVPVCVALLLWVGVRRPDILISGDAGLVGIMTQEGRALSKPKGSGFAASSWLENDGDAVGQSVAFERAGFTGKKGDLAAQLGGIPIHHTSGRGADLRAADACRTGTIVIAATDSGTASAPCLLFDRARLSESGATALYLGDEPRIVTVRDTVGIRPWNRNQ